MRDIRYLIVPTGVDFTCPRCRESMSKEDVRFAQFILLSKFIDHYEEGGWDIDVYLEIGMGVPAHEKCAKKIKRFIQFSESSLSFVLLLSIAFVGLLSCLLFVARLNIFMVLIISILAVLGLFKFINDKWHDNFQKLIEREGFENLMPAYENLLTKGWRGKAEMKYESPDKFYSIQRFREDLNSICAMDEYCLIDTASGHVMDYNNITVLEGIYKSCIFRNRYFYD